MTNNTGTSYELLTKEIFSAILNQGSVLNIDVKHNVVLQGKTVEHQIDVYWEFEQGGIKHTVVVEAKDWNSPVKQGDLFQFKAVLDDLPGQPRGVFIARSGYQRGAKEYAKIHGIIIYELFEEPPLPSITMVEGSFGSFHLRFERLSGAAYSGPT
jgi:hypothetical protein